MSRVKQRVPIGYPRSPRALCTALPEREGAETLRLRHFVIALLHVYSSSSYKDDHIE